MPDTYIAQKLLQIARDVHARIHELEAQLAQADRERPATQPLPAQPEAGVTLAELDATARAVLEGYCWDTRIAASEMLRALRPLVEEAECKRRIVDAGFEWQECRSTDGAGAISLCKQGPGAEPWPGWRAVAQTWPAAAAWAEAQGPKGERWSEPVQSMTVRRLYELLDAIAPGHDSHPINPRLYLRIAADKQRLYDAERDRVQLPPEEATP